MPERRLFAVDGMFCVGCARGLEKRLLALDGVVAANVHFATASTLVQWDPACCGTEDIAGCVAQRGYRLMEPETAARSAARLGREVRRLTIRLAVSVVLGMWGMAMALVLYLVPNLATETRWWLAAFSGLLAAPVLLYAAADIHRMAWRSLRMRAPGMDLLVSAGAIVAVVLSLRHLAAGGAEVYFDTAVMLVTLLLVGRLVDTLARRGALEALAAMEAAAPELALRVNADGTEEEVSCAALLPGDHVLVDAGAVATVDGIVLKGESRIDSAILTGESAPRTVRPGDRVAAGSVNQQRRLLLRVDRVQGDRDVDRMGGRVAIEIARRGQAQHTADRLAAALTLGIPLAAALALLGNLLAGASLEAALVRGLTVMVVACPCALSMAAPLVHLRASMLAAQRGLRIRDPEAFEALSHIRSAVFDKTGTLTEGCARVVGVEAAPGWTEADVLCMAARAETGIDHPLAQAILERHGVTVGDGGERLPRGATTMDEQGRRILVNGEDHTASQASATGSGATRLAVSLDDVRIGAVVIDDRIRQDARGLVQWLRHRAVTLRIATGDAAGPAQAVAALLGMDRAEALSGCTPEQKADLVRSLPGPVLFVGDGVNDAPALAAAACGVSVAGAHSAAAATAHLVIMGRSIGALRDAIQLAVATRRHVQRGLWLALIYNGLAIPAATLGLLGPGRAAMLMLLSSISVVGNALSLRLPAGQAERGIPVAGR